MCVIHSWKNDIVDIKIRLAPLRDEYSGHNKD